MNEIKTVWITRYALSQGIIKVNAEISGDMAIYRIGKPFNMYAHGQNKDWHLTEQSALERFETMRQSKIYSLNAQIKKVSKREPKIISL